jgi:hypothetical protein
MARTFSALVVLAALALGCSSEPTRKPVFAASGTATFKGEPMRGALISFHPLGDPDPLALRAQATADTDGRFALTTYATGDGAPAGAYAVTIYWPSKRAKGKAADAGEEDDVPPCRLNRAHADPKTTKLRATVREHSNTIDFTLP